MEYFQDFWKYGAKLSWFFKKWVARRLQIAKKGILRFLILVLLGKYYRSEIWTTYSPHGLKKSEGRFFPKNIFFQNGGHFCRKNRQNHRFCPINGRHFEKNEFLEKIFLHFFLNHGEHMWSKFQLHRSFLAKLVSKNVKCPLSRFEVVARHIFWKIG